MNDASALSTEFTRLMPTTWISDAQLRAVAERVGTPAFVYSETRLVENVERMQEAARAAGLLDRVAFYVPFFPNSNPHVVRAFKDMDIGVLIQLPSEYELLRRHGFEKFIVSTGHISDAEIEFWAGTGQPVFLSSMDEVAHLITAAPEAPINVRFDSLSSGKPGLKYNELYDFSELLKAHGGQLNCFELYCGSGNSVHTMLSIVEQVFMIFKTYFPQAKAINFAGGFSFAYEELATDAKHFRWDYYFQKLRALADRFEIPSDVSFWFEPARENVRLARVIVLNPPRVTVKTACSACLRSPSRSSRSVWARRLSPATRWPIGSRLSLDATPCRPPGRRLGRRDMQIM